MSRNPKLNDLQLILLSTAAQRNDGSILPPPDSIASQDERIRKAIPPLLKRGLIEEMPVKRGAPAWRDEDERPIGLRLTDKGRALIAPEEEQPQPAMAAKKAPDGNADGAAAAPRSGTKAELVLALLGRSKGATLHELVDATGWLPHTTRAALTGVRKKGHVVEKTKRGDATCYRIAETA